MKILLFNGSPRSNGNTVRLMNMVAESAQTECSDVEVTTFHLNDMDFKGCQGCLGCKQEKATGCIVKDDLAPALEAMLTADAIVVGTPVYMGHVTGQLKSFWDRTYGFIAGGGENRLPKGKKGVVAITQGVVEPGHYQAMTDLIVGSLSRRGLQVRAVVAGNTKGLATGDISFNAQTESSARDIGKWLTQ